jgi:hypothetical protein
MGEVGGDGCQPGAFAPLDLFRWSAEGTWNRGLASPAGGFLHTFVLARAALAALGRRREKAKARTAPAAGEPELGGSVRLLIAAQQERHGVRFHRPPRMWAAPDVRSGVFSAGRFSHRSLDLCSRNRRDLPRRSKKTKFDACPRPTIRDRRSRNRSVSRNGRARPLICRAPLDRAAAGGSSGS